MKVGSLISYFEETDSQPCTCQGEVCVCVCVRAGVGVCKSTCMYVWLAGVKSNTTESEKGKTCSFKYCRCFDNYGKKLFILTGTPCLVLARP